MSLQAERGADAKAAGFGGTAIQGLGDGFGWQLTDMRRHEQVQKIAVGIELARRPTFDRGVIGVDGVGDDRRCGIGCRGVRRQRRHRSGDAERERPPSPARGSDAAHRPVVSEPHSAMALSSWPALR